MENKDYGCYAIILLKNKQNSNLERLYRYSNIGDGWKMDSHN